MKTRYRVTEVGYLFWKKQVLVLQILKEQPIKRLYSRHYSEPTTIYYWQDARPEDLLESEDE